MSREHPSSLEMISEYCPDCGYVHVWDVKQLTYVEAQMSRCIFESGHTVYVCSIWTCLCGGMFATRVHRVIHHTEQTRVFVATL